jgi:hypothetical protein
MIEKLVFQKASTVYDEFPILEVWDQSYYTDMDRAKLLCTIKISIFSRMPEFHFHERNNPFILSLEQYQEILNKAQIFYNEERE